ncbi:hypothetical protein ETAA8_23310 [Anatilimnocola aggregata]|uniref:Uncharacterized protein n=1 Tax=Anatilimnocola aggregata TaxID=2528021 RepID=A0A517YAJ9_9BACT|nr:hypothetical protein [Anatilimnocola aggregata]QDU27244.1 hypothetical protein ETAA8_23310 [Anatilimnocola aggregata]
MPLRKQFCKGILFAACYAPFVELPEITEEDMRAGLKRTQIDESGVVADIVFYRYTELGIALDHVLWEEHENRDSGK